MAWVTIWTFDVRPEHEPAFVRTYGADGAWARLFRESPGYLGTSLLRDDRVPGRFATLDRWRSRADFDRFKAEHAEAYAALDRACEAWTTQEQALGGFELVSGQVAPPGS